MWCLAWDTTATLQLSTRCPQTTPTFTPVQAQTTCPHLSHPPLQPSAASLPQSAADGCGSAVSLWVSPSSVFIFGCTLTQRSHPSWTSMFLLKDPLSSTNPVFHTQSCVRHLPICVHVDAQHDWSTHNPIHLVNSLTGSNFLETSGREEHQRGESLTRPAFY